MISGNIKIGKGLESWMAGLGKLMRRRQNKPPEAGGAAKGGRPEPETEGERALYQAMGWKDSAWEE